MPTTPPLDTDAYESFMDDAFGCTERQKPGDRGWTNLVRAAELQLELAEQWNFN